MAKIEYEFINRSFNREMDEHLLEIEYDLLKQNSNKVFEIIEQKKVPMKIILNDVKKIYGYKYFWNIYLVLLILTIVLCIFETDISIFLLIITSIITIKILGTFYATYQSAKDGFNFEKQFYETHYKLVLESKSYSEYLNLFEKLLKEERIGWRPTF